MESCDKCRIPFIPGSGLLNEDHKPTSFTLETIGGKRNYLLCEHCVELLVKFLDKNPYDKFKKKKGAKK